MWMKFSVYTQHSFTMQKAISATDRCQDLEEVPLEQERRIEPRRDCFKVARAILGSRIVEGTLRSLSMQGARLHLPNAPLAVPNAFDLYLDGDVTCYSVRVIWKRGQNFGVVFNSIAPPHTGHTERQQK